MWQLRTSDLDVLPTGFCCAPELLSVYCPQVSIGFLASQYGSICHHDFPFHFPHFLVPGCKVLQNTLLSPQINPDILNALLKRKICLGISLLESTGTDMITGRDFCVVPFCRGFARCVFFCRAFHASLSA